MGPHLQHIANAAPITALAFLARPAEPLLLLAGEGPFVRILAPAPSAPAPPKTRRIFARERIHGIALSRLAPHVLFWGGRSISIASVSALLTLQRPPLREISAPDWIFHACFLPCVHGDIPRVAVVTAHNALLLFSPYTGWTSAASGERCMLYSAHIHPLPDRILVAAGTVFGEILVWSVPTAGDDTDPTLHHRLTGHEGSIFSVAISPPSSRTRYLASCSDDRTVRLWDISTLPSTAAAAAATSAPSSTGFTQSPGSCIAVGWAHTARIWGVQFVPDDQAARLVSVSEDLTSRFWRFDGRALVNTATHLLHSGKHIWSYALAPQQQHSLLATGGADGRVGLIEYGHDHDHDHPEEVYDAAAISNSAVKAYAVLDSARFVATTVQGDLLLYSLATRTWTTLASIPALHHWSVVAAWRDAGVVALGDGGGRAGVYRVGDGAQVWWDARSGGKVGGVWTATDTARGLHMLLTTSLAGDCGFALHFLTRDLALQETVVLPAPPREDGAKSFVVTCMGVDCAAGIAILGSRHGAVAAYAFSGALLGCWSGVVHGGDAVTGIECRAAGGVVATGRDGGYSVLAFAGREGGGKMKMAVQHAAKAGMGGVVEGVVPGTERVVLYGFRGKCFFVWDQDAGCEVARVECGGAHRAWAFYWPPGGDGEGWLVWTKAAKVHIARAPLTRQRLLQQGLHGREMKAIALAPDQRVLATGAEDTVIRLSQLDVDTGRVRSVAVFKRHTTGVQHLAWSACGRWLFSSGGVEEFFVWRVRPLAGSVGVVEEAKCPVGEAGGDLRICGFDAASLYSEGEAREVVGFVIAMVYSDSTIKIYNYNISTKTFTPLIHGAYKTCCLQHCSLALLHSQVHLLAASTDGHITAWNITAPLSHFNIAATATQLTLHPLTPSQKKKRKKQAKSPDPKNAVRALPAPAFSKAVHQSGIKALAVVAGDAAIEVLSGGDDCAFAVTRVALTADTNTGAGIEVKTWVLPRAHASAVTAVLRVGRWVVTAGVDQMLRVWDVRVVGGEVEVGRVAEGYTSVADVAGVVGVRRVVGGGEGGAGAEGADEGDGVGWVVVAGVGLDVWSVG